MSDRSFGQDIEEDGLCDAVRPDSDAHEARHTQACATRRGKWCDCEGGAAVLLRKDLAQRILAALEDPDGSGIRPAALAAELRAVIGK